MSARGLMAAVDWLSFEGDDGGNGTNKRGNGSTCGGLLGNAMASTL